MPPTQDDWLGRYITSHFPSEIPLKMMGKSLHKCTREKKERKKQRQQQQHFGTWKTLGHSGTISGNLKKCKPVKNAKKGPDGNPGTSRRCRNWQRCWGTGVTKNRSSVKARLRSSQSPEPLFSCTPSSARWCPALPQQQGKIDKLWTWGPRHKGKKGCCTGDRRRMKPSAPSLLGSTGSQAHVYTLHPVFVK